MDSLMERRNSRIRIVVETSRIFRRSTEVPSKFLARKGAAVKELGPRIALSGEVRLAHK